MIVFNMVSVPFIGITCVIFGVIIFAIDLMLPLGVAGGVPYIAVVLISLKFNKAEYTVYTAFACTLLVILGYLYSPEGGELWKVVLNRVLAVFAIWVTALLSIKIIRESQKEIKMLQGLLPICSSCKKVRDDEGYWNQIESYVRTHSEAEFSHGICPDCFKENYPGYEYKANLSNKETKG